MKSLFPKRLKDHIFQNGLFYGKMLRLTMRMFLYKNFISKSLFIPVKSVSEYCVYIQNAFYSIIFFFAFAYRAVRKL